MCGIDSNVSKAAMCSHARECQALAAICMLYNTQMQPDSGSNSIRERLGYMYSARPD